MTWHVIICDEVIITAVIKDEGMAAPYNALLLVVRI
jgi:hypothetical protein